MTEGHKGENKENVARRLGELPSVLAAAHELKAPLSLVRQLSLTLERGELKPSEYERMLRQITLTSEQALRLTTDLTRASRLQSTLFELEPVNTMQLCDDVAHELSPLFNAHNKSIRVASKRRQVLAVANRDLLKRIIANFSDNALHYAGADSKVELSTSLMDHGRMVRVAVRDYGPSLPGDLWKKLNKNLTSSLQPVHSRPGSSGLGLYLAGQFAEAMNGNIGVTRHHDGATFYVDIHASSQLRLL